MNISVAMHRALPFFLALCYIMSTLSHLIPSNHNATEHVVMKRQSELLPVFANKTEFDIITVLLLLGESVIWKVVWSRFRFKRRHWRQWIFAISPGWAPLAATVFTGLQTSRGPPNLIYDRPPAETIDSNLILTNLSSGASHPAANVRIQNIWQVWHRGPRGKHLWNQKEDQVTTREVGIIDVDLTSLSTPANWTFYLQVVVLIAQLGASLTLGFFGWSFEIFIGFLITLSSQFLLIAAVTPRLEAWENGPQPKDRASPVMLHMGMTTDSVLFVRSIKKNGNYYNPEDFCHGPQTLRNKMDFVNLFLAGASVLGFILQFLLLGWMTSSSRLVYLVLGSAGLIANGVEGAFDPDWCSIYDRGFRGEAFCEPEGSSLMSAVGVLLAGNSAAAEAASKLLYPDNSRFSNSRRSLVTTFNSYLCENCRNRIGGKLRESTVCTKPRQRFCHADLPEEIAKIDSKQVRDGVATVCHYLRHDSNDRNLPRIVTKGPRAQHTWEKA